LNDSPQGLSAYGLVKEFREHFNTLWTPSAGTIYPLLKRLVKDDLLTENIVEDTSIFVINEKGKVKLKENLPDTIQNSLESIPVAIKLLIKALPFPSRIRISAQSPWLFTKPDHCGGMCDAFNIKEQICNFGQTNAIPRLEDLKTQLNRTKEDIKAWSDKEIQHIDAQIQQIDEQIKKINEEKKKWVKIPVEDGDSESSQ
jgi:DNA-binding PadR family transcriptional regulator